VNGTNISAERLREFAAHIFQAAGVESDDARRAADVLIWTSLRGVDTHGIRNLKRYYIQGIDDGTIDPVAQLQVERESGGTATLNSNAGLGLCHAVQAMRRAIDKADSGGVGVVTVRNANHFGAAGYYAHMAVESGMIGFAATGYFFPHGQRTAVVPFGGLLPMLSTNPLAMACPCSEMPPFVLDMSTSISAFNRIELWNELGRTIPTGWALDEEHQPTTDPSNVHKLVSLGGLDRMGGHKGFGLALAVQILTGLLSGAWREDPKPDRILGDRAEAKDGFGQEGIGHIFAAVRIDQFGPPDQFRRGVDAMIKTLNESPPRNGVDRVYVPGQLEHEAERKRSRAGIPIHESTLTDLRELSARFGVALDVP